MDTKKPSVSSKEIRRLLRRIGDLNMKKKTQTQEWIERAECSVTGAVGWMFRVSQLVGIAPVRFDRHRISVSPALCIVHCTIMTAMNILGIYAMVRDLTVSFEHSIRVHSFSDRILWTLDFSFVMLIASVATYTAPKRVQEVIRCLSRIQKIKKGMNSSQVQEYDWFEKKKCALLVSFLAFTTTTVFIDYWYQVHDMLENGQDMFTSSLYSSYEAGYIMLFTLEMQFLFSALEVYGAFKMLNDGLEKATHRNTAQSFVVNQPTKTMEETIHHLASTYNSLFIVVKRLEKTFGFALILLMSSCLLHMVMAPNNTIWSWSGTLHGGGRELVIQLTWCVLHLTCTVVIVEPSHLTLVEMDRTHLLVSQLILQNSDGLVSEELDKFHKYLLLNKIMYTPMGICTLSRSLLATMLGSVATYLIILIQMTNFEKHST